MQSFADSNLTSNRSPLDEAVDAAHVRAGRARRLASAILETAVRLYSEKGSGRGWLWRYAR